MRTQNVGILMNVGDLMTRDIVLASERTTTRDLARIMAERNVGMVVITREGEGKRCTGLVTDRQIAVDVVGRGRDPDAVPAVDIMTKAPVTCREDTTIFDAAATCFQRGRPFRRLPVVDDDGNAVGVISIADLALAAHPLIEAVLRETEASVEETKVHMEGLKRDLERRVAASR